MSQLEKFFKDKRILVTGGTGSIGSEVLRRLVDFEAKEIIVYSRDEYKQHQLRYKYASRKNIKFIIGDVRDLERMIAVSRKVDIIFHCAALKHVPISEEMPEEFVKTNILGAINLSKAAIENKVPVVISISTDKVVNPSNVMGLTKAIQEKIFISQCMSGNDSNQRFANVRFGNVIGTHGSLFPIFHHQMVNDQPLTVTDLDMTRFFMSADEAVDLIFWAAINAGNGETVIRKMKSVKISEIISCFAKELDKPADYPVKMIGIRPGEKNHEYLISGEEVFRYRSQEEYIVISPYQVVDLERNALSSKKTTQKIGLEDFYSDYSNNFMTEVELRNYVRNYLKQAKGISQFI